MTPTALAEKNAQQDSDERAIDRALVDFLARQFPQASRAQCRLAGFVSRQLQAGHICQPTGTDTVAAENYCGEPLADLLTDNPLISTNGTTPLVLDQDRLYLCRYWQLETAIARHIQARLDEPLFDANRIREPLATLFHDSNDDPDWQQIACALAGRKRIGIITGGPGTGKTTTVVKLLALLQQQACHDKPLHIELAAPTGKAAMRLNESITSALDKLTLPEAVRAAIPREARTLHRLLGHASGTRHFRHHARNRLLADLVVIDEASMIDIDQTAQLLNALPAHCRLILVGDSDQLASVEAGAVLSDLCGDATQGAYNGDTRTFIEQATGVSLASRGETGSPLAQQTVTLSTNWRSRDAPGINVLAQAICHQNTDAVKQAFIDYPVQLERQQRQSGWIEKLIIKQKNGIADVLSAMHSSRPAANAGKQAIADWATMLLTRLAQHQLLTPLRHGPHGTIALNAAITETLRQEQLIPGGELFAGMPVLITRNIYDLGLMNGDLGLILNHPAQSGLRMAFKAGKTIRWFLPEQLTSHSDTAFALSVHKAQGSEFNHVTLCMPAHPSPLLTREFLYTAVTRAREKLIVLEHDPLLFTYAIQRKTQRHSGLAQRLHSVD